MDIEFDPAKSARNLTERGIPFEHAERMEWGTAMLGRDTRKDYGEDRWTALGFIDTRLHVLIYAKVGITSIRVISLRKANERERRMYEQAQA